MSGPEALRIAAVGAGYFARFHCEAWSRIEGARLVALCDADRDKALALAAAHGVPEVFTAVDDMLDRAAPDLLDMITPPASHLEIVAEAASRGISVICQKPLAPDLASAERLVALAEDAGILLVVHENFRFQPWFREAGALLAAGALGTPHAISFRLRPGDGQGPRAYLDRQPYFQAMPRFLIHETGIHFIDTFRSLLGEVSAVTARLRRLNPVIAGEDAGTVVFDFASGASGLFDGNRLNDHVADDCRLTMGEMHLEGSGGVLRLDGDGRLWLKPHRGREREHRYSWQRCGFAGDCVHALQRHVIEHLLGGAPLVNDGRAYLVNLRIEEAIYRSHDSGRRVILPADDPAPENGARP